MKTENRKQMKKIFQKQNGYAVTNKYYVKLKSKWADAMNKITAGLSIQYQQLLWGSFIVLGSALSGYSIFNGIAGNNDRSIQILKIAKTKMPQSFGVQESYDSLIQIALKKEQLYNRYIDSLSGKGR